MNRHLIHLFITLLPLATALTATADDTTRKGPLRPRAKISASALRDTVAEGNAALTPDSLTIAAFDKPLRSLRETFFVTNRRRASRLLSLTLRLTYHRHGADNAMLHSRTLTVKCDIPPGETRQLYILSWDRQYNFYYHATRIPSPSSRAIPFDVTLHPISAAFSSPAAQ